MTFDLVKFQVRPSSTKCYGFPMLAPNLEVAFIAQFVSFCALSRDCGGGSLHFRRSLRGHTVLSSVKGTSLAWQQASLVSFSSVGGSWFKRRGARSYMSPDAMTLPFGESANVSGCIANLWSFRAGSFMIGTTESVALLTTQVPCAPGAVKGGHLLTRSGRGARARASDAPRSTDTVNPIKYASSRMIPHRSVMNVGRHMRDRYDVPREAPARTSMTRPNPATRQTVRSTPISF